MIVVIMQPTYLPWLGYFDLVDRADTFVFYDNVQFDYRSWQHRNRIKGPHGPAWLTVPVAREHRPRIDAVKIHDDRWAQKHWRSLLHAYGRAPHFAQYRSDLSQLFDQPWTHLCDLNIALIRWLANALGVRADFRRASELDVAGSRVARLLGICQQLGGNHYLSPAGAADYISADNQFEGSGVKLEIQNYRHPTYRQQHGDFVPYMSALDLLLNEGADSLDVLRRGAG